MYRNRDQAGFTLVELLISIAIIAVAVSGVLLMSSQALRYSTDPLIRRQALAIAESYLEEINARYFADPDDNLICGTPEGGRQDFDDVCDYDGLKDDGARNLKGEPVGGLERYRVQVQLDRNVNWEGIQGQARILRVTVQVDHPLLGSPVLLAAYRTNF